MGTTDSIITARIPKEIRDQGDLVLKRIDSSVTELVNSAFEYVIKTGELPSKQRQFNASEKAIRKFDSAEQREQFIMHLKATSLPMSLEYANMTAKEIRAMRLAKRCGDQS